VLEEDAVAYLVKGLEDKSPLVRSDCAKILCGLAAEKDFQNREVVDVLLKRLKDDGSLDVRVSIARELKALGRDDVVVYELMQCLKTDYQQLRFAAVNSLTVISKRDFNLNYDYWLDWYVSERVEGPDAKRKEKKGFFWWLFPWQW
jgi:HEAT repeat protein